MIRRELDRLLCALQFMTRLPAPAPRDWSAELFARSARYFPLAGLAAGGISGGVLLLARRIWPAGALPAILALAAGVLTTGGLHEDGLADTADGLGGGRTPAQRLAILKDSRLGAYGGLALGLVLAIRAGALAEMRGPATAALALLAAHAGARAAAVVAMAALPYAADPAASKLQAGTTRDLRAAEVLIALGLGLAPLALLPPRAAAAGAAAGALATLWPALAARRLIGGYTGDILGAVEQAFETAFLLAAAAALAQVR